MNRAHTAILAFVIASGGIVIAACADSEGDAAPAPNDHDGSITPNDAATETPDAAPDAAPRTCSVHGFCHTKLPGDHQKLEAVWGDGAGVVWAVSAEGNVLRWDGSAWKVHASKLGPLHALWGAAPNDIWVGGDLGLYHGTGATPDALVFTAVTIPGGAVRIGSIWGPSAAEVWATGRTEVDGGEPLGELVRCAASACAVDPLSTQDLAFSHVWGTPTAGTWVTGSRVIPGESVRESVVFRKTTGSFAEVALPFDPDQGDIYGRLGQMHAVNVPAPGSMILLGYTTTEARGYWRGTSTDNEKTYAWTYEPSGRFDDPHYNAAYGIAANDVIAVGEYGRVRHWDGTTWKPVAITRTNVPVVDPLYGVWRSGAEETWIVGDGIALRYDSAQKKDGTAQ